MTKTLNYRPIFYTFISLALGIFFARRIFCGDVFYIVGIICAFVAIFLVCFYSKHFARFVATILAFGAGVGIFSISCLTFNNCPFDSGIYTISGRVNTTSSYSSGQALIIDNVYIDGTKIDKAVKVFVSYSAGIEEGYVITFTDYLEKTSLYTLGEFNNYEYKYNIAYSANVDSVVIDRFDGLTISESLRLSVKKVLYDNLENDTASVCYASLFGDKSLISENIRNDFSVSGIAHLLAVSGLHVGFIASFLSILLRKVRKGKILRPIVVGSFLLFYCYLCLFSASVVRASVMFFVIAMADVFGKKYDRLNSLGIAGIVVLLYKPLFVYDAGFLLSFFCVFSISMFMPLFNRLLSKTKLPQWLCESIAIIFSVQLGMLPLTIYYYGQVSLLSMLANFICVPIFEIFFILLLACLPLVLIIPPVGFCLLAPGVVINGIMFVAKVIANQFWAVVYLGWIPVLLVVAIYFVMFIFSHFTNLKFSYKTLYSSLILIFASILVFGINMPTNCEFGITTLNSYGNMSYVVEFSGEKYLFSDYDYFSSKNADVYFSSLVHSKAKALFYFGKETLYFNNNFEAGYTASSIIAENSLLFNHSYEIGNVVITPCSIDNTLRGYMIECGETKVFVCTSMTESSHVMSIINDFESVEFLICSSDILTGEYIFDAKYIISDGKRIQCEDKITNMTGNWTIDIKNDKLKVRNID